MYTIYHIPGVKVGCSNRVEARVKDQGYTNYEVLGVYDDIKEASVKEKELQRKYGYRVDGGDYSHMLQRNKLSRMPEARQRQVASLLKSSARQAVYERKYRITLQFDLKGNFIKEWIKAKDASIALDICASDICACCRGKQKTAKGFIWKYKN